MPNLGHFHPQIVHFVMALGLVGVLFRVISLAGKWSWVSNAAAALLLMTSFASWVAVKSGTDAHGPVERVPGARQAVITHEEWGERTRNIFFGIAALEIIGLFVAAGPRRRLAHGAAALVGLAGAAAIYETGEHGGELVYSYAGGVGIRTGDPQDVNRLLLSGLYHQAMQDRKEGKGTDAGALISTMRQRFPQDTTVRLLAIESMMRDLGNPAGALVALDSMAPAGVGNDRLRRSMANVRIDALLAAGMKDSARAVLGGLIKEMPENPRYKAKLDSLK